MTETGRSFAIARLASCHDLGALRRVWESLGAEYQRDPTIQRFKDDLKARLS